MGTIATSEGRRATDFRPVTEQNSTSDRTARRLRTVLAALVPPLTALAIEIGVFPAAWIRSRWLLMIPAVIVSAAIGGMVSGLVATITCAALVSWIRFSSVRTTAAFEPWYSVSLVFFLGIGYAISLQHERSRRLKDSLTRAARQNRIFAALIENATDFIGVADPGGHATYVSPGGRRMVELPADVEIERTTIVDYFPSELHTFVQGEMLPAMHARGRWLGETSLRNWRTGARIPVLASNFLVRDTVTQRVIATATITRDISEENARREELKQTNARLVTAIRQLAESQRLLQGVLDYSPNGIAIKSLDGRYIAVNDSFRGIMGLAPDAARGRADAELMPISLAQRLHENDERVLTTNQPVVTEESTTIDGTRRDFVATKFPLRDDTDRIVALGAIWMDITQRKHDEEMLRQSTADLEAAQHVAHVGSWRWDSRTGEITVSEELYRIFGLDPTHTRPRFLTDPECKVLTDEYKARLRAATEQLLADGRPCELELAFTRPDGAMGWVTVHGEPVRDEIGRVVGISATAADITRLKELQRLHDEWTSVIAHDLRQPIATILMASGFLPEVHKGEPTDAERDLLQRIHSAVESLRRMVDDLLDVSLLEAQRLKLERKWAKPQDIVHESLALLAHLRGIERVHELEDGDLPAIQVDPMRIEQVLQNLISNAIKYGDADTEIVVRVKREPNEVSFSVTNRGAGIAADELPRLFERFARSRTTRGTGTPGLGLGLYIVKGLVEAHGGRIWAESSPGQATTFHFTLPISAEMRQAA